MPMLLWNADGITLHLHDEPAACPLAAFTPHVSTAEMQRALAMGSAARAHTFLSARQLLRQHLATLLNQPASQLEIAIAPNGKPFLPGHAASFSIAHSHGKILLGIAAGERAIGVDLQYMDPTVDIIKLGQRFFSSADYNGMMADPNPRQAGFLLWCQYESAFKAHTETGKVGKSWLLKDYVVTLQSD